MLRCTLRRRVRGRMRFLMEGSRGLRLWIFFLGVGFLFPCPTYLTWHGQYATVSFHADELHSSETPTLVQANPFVEPCTKGLSSCDVDA
jgi:hypothetical protein